MTTGSTPIPQTSTHGMQVVLATAFILGLLLVAAQVGVLPKAPTFPGAVPADQYLSSQTLGERLADR